MGQPGPALASSLAPPKRRAGSIPAACTPSRLEPEAPVSQIQGRARRGCGGPEEWLKTRLGEDLVGGSGRALV